MGRFRKRLRRGAPGTTIGSRIHLHGTGRGAAVKELADWRSVAYGPGSVRVVPSTVPGQRLLELRLRPSAERRVCDFTSKGKPLLPIALDRVLVLDPTSVLPVCGGFELGGLPRRKQDSARWLGAFAAYFRYGPLPFQWKSAPLARRSER